MRIILLLKWKALTGSISGSSILYFSTQSNIISAIEKGETTYEEVEGWLNEELAEFFKNAKETRIIFFGNWIKFIQKI